MKKFLVLIFLATAFVPLKAQFVFSAGPVVGLNSGSNFRDFRKQYNDVNGSGLSRKMGSPAFLRGYSAMMGFHILQLSSSLGRQQISASTHATLSSGTKRQIDFSYKLTTINIGYFYPGERNEWSLEIGMVHALTDLYSYMILPNGERDYFLGGISGAHHWVNIGMNLKFFYTKPIGDKVRLNFEGTGFIVNNEKSPYYIDGGTAKATMTLKGFTVSAGIAFVLGEHIE